MPGHFKVVVALSLALCANHVFGQTTGRLTPGTGIITGTIQMDGGGSAAGVRCRGGADGVDGTCRRAAARRFCFSTALTARSPNAAPIRRCARRDESARGCR